VDLEGLRGRLLDARDARARLIAALQESAHGPRASRERPSVFLSLNVPGPRKDTACLDRVFARGRAALVRWLAGSGVAVEGRDALGPYLLATVEGEAADVKRGAVQLEESLPFGRLLDIDVFGPDGRQVDRNMLGLPSRRCFLCTSPAVECIRARRHSPEDVLARARRLARTHLDALAEALVDGARAELALTPKPGLVDRADNGSHPDLTYASMARSIDMLPAYYSNLVPLVEEPEVDLAACRDAGVQAEARMTEVARSNTHRGYIFLSGLLLVALGLEESWTIGGWRRQIASLAGRIIDGRAAFESHGAAARRHHAVRGVHGEALEGLPSVFEHALPALAHGLARFPSRQAAEHYAMARLMAEVEDTTAIHRCGPAGLARVKSDGAALASLIEEGGDHTPRLRQLNEEYRAAGLTMGGVADCLGLTLALHAVLPGLRLS
jgi:triphosphoribosyl-dephospho-CoA synthase